MKNICHVFCGLKLHAIYLAVVAAALMTACGTAPKVIKVDQTRVDEYARRGYDSGIDYATAVTRFSMQLENDFILVTAVQPKREGKYPLVIYLPGLGESADAAPEIRNAWAKSGYVVLSLQPLKEDEDIWSSDAARRADFDFIRQDRYSPGVISHRIDVIRGLIGYLKRGIASGDENLGDADFSRIALIGFDVGASTAMIVCGEEVPKVSAKVPGLQPEVVIALSPHADPAGADVDTRYQDIGVPVLSVTGNSDDETHGNEPISLHQIPFQHMPPGNKFLLLLANASHSLIGDGDTSNDVQTESEGEGKQAEHESSGNSRSRSARHEKGGSRAEADENGSSKRDGERSPTQRAKVKVAIAQVTTAFLNAYVKKDQFAVDWLNKNAQIWLYGIGELQEK